MKKNLFKTSFILFLSAIAVSASASEYPYTCPQIKRFKEELSWKCLENASDELIYKGQMMSQLLLDQVEKLEEQIGEPQDVFIIARAGSSLTGFDQLKSHDENGNSINLDTIFDYGVNQMPNKSVDRENYERWSSNKIQSSFRGYNEDINNARANISNKFVDNKRQKLVYSHAGILYKTKDNIWNIYHELMPCNEKKKAYLFQDAAKSGKSSFFIDKPHQYKALVLPLNKELQRRIQHTIHNQNQYMVRGPVYKAMASPWQANTQNSNSFVLEMVELASMPEAWYNIKSIEYKARRRLYNKFIKAKRRQHGVNQLSVEQKEFIETKDPYFKKICRPDYFIRKDIVKSYILNGYEPTKIVFDSSFNFKNGFKSLIKESLQMMKVTFIPFVGEHMRPSKATYAEHMKLGVGEAVTVYSILKYLQRTGALHPQADASLFEIPELTYKDAQRLALTIKQNIAFYNTANQDEEFEKLDAVLRKMKKKGK